MIWLGERRGYLSDWATQLWVRVTGRTVDLAESSWLDGPVGLTRGIGEDFLPNWAEERGLRMREDGAPRGLVRFEHLAGPDLDPAAADREVVRFYEQTSEFRLDAWSEWCGFFKPFGWLLARLFSRRLQQMNVPLSSLETSRGLTSRLIEISKPDGGSTVCTAWIRKLKASERVIYVGAYSVCRVPGHESPCVRVVFPLPNGSCMVILEPRVGNDGSFQLLSRGKGFGDPGFYFVVHGSNGRVHARRVQTFKEEITVYRGDDGQLRTDHDMHLWGLTFLRLHYRMQPKPPQSTPH